jgi:hypothetical protein
MRHFSLLFVLLLSLSVPVVADDPGPLVERPFVLHLVGFIDLLGSAEIDTDLTDEEISHLGFRYFLNAAGDGRIEYEMDGETIGVAVPTWEYMGEDTIDLYCEPAYDQRLSHFPVRLASPAYWIELDDQFWYLQPCLLDGEIATVLLIQIQQSAPQRLMEILIYSFDWLE